METTNGKIVNQESVKEGNEIILTSTVEERLTRQDILNRMESAKRQKENLVRQSKDIKALFESYTNQETKLAELLALLPEETIENI